MDDSFSIALLVGILAEICFAGRQIFQWWASEKAKSIQSPITFWIFSLIGSVFFLIYGVLRLDFAIVLGQFLNFYIYCRNLHFKGIWSRLSLLFQIGILALPLSIMSFLYVYYSETFNSVFVNNEIALGWLIFGTIGYLFFTIRFVYQWYVSESLGQSKLPVGFFVLSIIGSIIIIIYGWYRSDIILIVGYGGGLVVYLRNLMIHYQNNH